VRQTFYKFLVHVIWLNGREMDLAPLVATCRNCAMHILLHRDQIKFFLRGGKAETARTQNSTHGIQKGRKLNLVGAMISFDAPGLCLSQLHQQLPRSYPACRLQPRRVLESLSIGHAHFYLHLIQFLRSTPQYPS